MNPAEFCYWLRGFLEMADPQDMNATQTKMLKKHLDLVFVNVTHDEPLAVTEPKKELKKALLTDSPSGSAIQTSINDRIRDYQRSYIDVFDTKTC